MHTAINCNGKSLSSSASPTVDAQPEPPSLPMPPPTLAAFTRTMPTAISAISAVSACRRLPRHSTGRPSSDHDPAPTS
uniref:Uncharacterized protein n=1 Tax=Caenorhabditis japonica TaxID=281687 RepID=A0A2Q4SRZ1_CAEJA